MKLKKSPQIYKIASHSILSVESMVPERLLLSELTPIQSGGRSGGPPFGLDHSQPDSNAILLRPGMEFTYAINGLYDRLTGQIELAGGLEDEEMVEIMVSGDGRRLWHSSMKQDEGIKSVNLDIAGVKTLALRADGTVSWRNRTHVMISNAVLSQ